MSRIKMSCIKRIPVRCPPCGGHTGSWTVQALTPPSFRLHQPKQKHSNEGGGGEGGLYENSRTHTLTATVCVGCGGEWGVEEEEVEERGGGVIGQRQTRDIALQNHALLWIFSFLLFFLHISQDWTMQLQSRSPG